MKDEEDRKESKIPEVSVAGYYPGVCTFEHDSLSCGVGHGISVRNGLEMVSVQRGIYMAAKHLLDIYSAVRILLSARKEKIKERLHRVRGWASRIGCHCAFYAGKPDFIRCVYTDWFLYAFDDSNGEALKKMSDVSGIGSQCPSLWCDEKCK